MLIEKSINNLQEAGILNFISWERKPPLGGRLAPFTVYEKK